MPAPITSRAITIHMRRRAPAETIRGYRHRSAEAEAAPLRTRLQGWAEQNLAALTEAEPVLPDGVEDRPSEIWEPLIAMADQLGGDWGKRVRAACRYFVLDPDTAHADSVGVRLLADIKTVFGDTDRMFSDDLVVALIADPESEWTDVAGGPITPRRLAKELKPYGVRSQDIRIGETNRKGYTVTGATGLAQAWDRYLPRSNSNRSGLSEQQDISASPAPIRQRDTNATPQQPFDQQVSHHVADVADVTDKNTTPTRSMLDNPVDAEPAPSENTSAAPHESADSAIPGVNGRPEPPGGFKPDSPGQNTAGP